MIKRIDLERWKSFEKATLHLHPLTVIVGANASGKTNLLEGLRFLVRVVNQKIEETSRQQATLFPDLPLEDKPEKRTLNQQKTSPQWPIRGEEDAMVRWGSEDMHFTCHFPSVENDPAWLLKLDFIRKARAELKEPASDKAIVGKNKAHNGISLRPIRPGESPNALNVLGYLPMTGDGGPAPDSSIDELLAIGRSRVIEPHPDRMRDYAKVADRLETDCSNVAGFWAGLPGNEQEALDKSLNSYARRLREGDLDRIWAGKIPPVNRDAMLFSQEFWGAEKAPEPIDARTMSEGTLRFVAILVALLSQPKGSLLAIDDVDVGLHPSRMKLLLEVLTTVGHERGLTLVVTTHNPALMDLLTPEHLAGVQVVHRHPQTGAGLITPASELDYLPLLLADGGLGKAATSGSLSKEAERNGQPRPILSAPQPLREG